MFEADTFFSDGNFKKIISAKKHNLVNWYTSGKFQRYQNGGIINVDSQNKVLDVKIIKEFNAKYQNYLKMVGALYIGDEYVERYYELLESYCKLTIKQYYHQPLIDSLEAFPSYSTNLDCNGYFSFNTKEEYNKGLKSTSHSQ